MPTGARALPVLALDGPPIRLAELARGLGVEPVEVATAEALDDVLGAAMRHRGPMLSEAVMTAQRVADLSLQQGAGPG